MGLCLQQLFKHLQCWMRLSFGVLLFGKADLVSTLAHQPLPFVFSWLCFILVRFFLSFFLSLLWGSEDHMRWSQNLQVLNVHLQGLSFPAQLLLQPLLVHDLDSTNTQKEKEKENDQQKNRKQTAKEGRCGEGSEWVLSQVVLCAKGQSVHLVGSVKARAVTSSTTTIHWLLRVTNRFACPKCLSSLVSLEEALWVCSSLLFFFTVSLTTHASEKGCYWDHQELKMTAEKKMQSTITDLLWNHFYIAQQQVPSDQDSQLLSSLSNTIFPLEPYALSWISSLASGSL